MTSIFSRPDRKEDFCLFTFLHTQLWSQIQNMSLDLSINSQFET